MKTVLLTLLLFLSSCAGFRDVPADGGLRQQLIETLTVFGDAAVRLKGTELLREKAPHLLPLVDKAPVDGQVSLAEMVSFVQNADAATIVMLGAIYFQ